MKSKIKNLLVSFSGGETSAFMSQWLKNHYKELGYESIVFVFANTGQENEETLVFADKCDKKFNLNLHWIEASISLVDGVGTFFSITDYEHATRLNTWRFKDNTPFEMMIKKYGIPNASTPHCTRELKQVPISKFGKTYFNGEKYDTAIGIRADEFDRVNPSHKEIGLVYPLLSMVGKPITKPIINLFWRDFDFRLELKGYQGNCATCWKKSDSKIFEIIKESPEKIEFMLEMEKKYGSYIPQSRLKKRIKDGTKIPSNVSFFRNNRNSLEMIERAKKWEGVVKNDSENYTEQLDIFESESCEVFSNCGDK